MRASSKAYEDVACHCSEYLPVQKGNVSNCSNCDKKSCVTCRHFDTDKSFCKIDLYDRIVRNHHIDEEE
ncbi:MAG TPA: hypothetical protein DCE48_06505 [Lachnospiraceae bacterium]|uniref:hypothetical protein n=1 Tax=Anaerosporobacter sp. TaxID=1872529 RepID=UPI000EEC9411|nr:hypothetical protein [Anaerosporobacter sp.]MBS5934455.1 hypothetical protein [Clostridiales bacterium]HAB60347.1 hypothetical protein [Lachnospiraceae bacterium]